MVSTSHGQSLSQGHLSAAVFICTYRFTKLVPSRAAVVVFNFQSFSILRPLMMFYSSELAERLGLVSSWEKGIIRTHQQSSADLIIVTTVPDSFVERIPGIRRWMISNDV